MRIKLGPRTISIPAARLPQLGLPYLRLLTAIHLPIPKVVRIGGTRAALLSLLLVAAGFGISFALVIKGTTDEIIFPQAGAEYGLPNIVGVRLPPDADTPMTGSQTLRIGFKDGTRLDRLVLKDLDLGKIGIDKSFEITRNATTGVTGAQAYLWIGDIVITNSSAPALSWGDMEIGSATLAPRTDGHTQEIQQDSTVTEVIVDSDRGSGSYTVEGSKVDRIILQINGSTKGASIGVLEINNVDSHTGSWDWRWIKAGSLSLDATNEFGNGSGIEVASAIWSSTISARVVVDSIVDVPLSVR